MAEQCAVHAIVLIRTEDFIRAMKKLTQEGNGLLS